MTDLPTEYETMSSCSRSASLQYTIGTFIIILLH